MKEEEQGRKRTRMKVKKQSRPWPTLSQYEMDIRYTTLVFNLFIILIGTFLYLVCQYLSTIWPAVIKPSIHILPKILVPFCDHDLHIKVQWLSFLTLVLLNKLRYHTHFSFQPIRLLWMLNDKQCRSRSVGFLEANWSESTLFAKAGQRLNMDFSVKFVYNTDRLLPPAEFVPIYKYKALYFIQILFLDSHEVLSTFFGKTNLECCPLLLWMVVNSAFRIKFSR